MNLDFIRILFMKDKSDQINIYTTKIYKNLNPSWHIKDSPWKCKKILDVIPPSFSFGNKLKILDIGCGVGEILKLVSAKVEALGSKTECFGYDISPHAIKEARKNFPKATFKCKEFSKADLGGVVDITLLIDILEHLKTPDRLLSELEKTTNCLIVHVPLEKNLALKIRKKEMKKRSDHLGHIHHYDRKSAIDMLEKHDFKVVRSMYTCFDVDGNYKYDSKLNRVLGGPLRRTIYKISPSFLSKSLGCSLMCFLKNTKPIK